jgi:hypothetical protein
MSYERPPEAIVHDAALDVARRRLNLSIADLWLEYFALGGQAGVDGLAAYLRNERDFSDTEHNIVAHAMNERFHDGGLNHPLAYFPA